MNYVTTNIRIPEDDYLRFKTEAARKRKSLSAVIRDKLGASNRQRSGAEIKKIMASVEKLGKELGEKLHDFDSVKALREMRYEDR